MKDFSIREAAVLLGVSEDTVRRWGESGRIAIGRGENGRQSIPGTELVALQQEAAAGQTLAETFPGIRASARNRFVGLVTSVTKDGVMAQVDIQAGPFRVVSLMSREAADDLGLEVGMLAAASAKATVVTVELPEAGG